MRNIAQTWVLACAFTVGCAGVNDREERREASGAESRDATSLDTAGEESAARGTGTPGEGSETARTEPASFQEPGAGAAKGSSARSAGGDGETSRKKPTDPATGELSPAAKLRAEGFHALTLRDARLERHAERCTLHVQVEAPENADVRIAPRRAEDPVAIELEVLGRSAAGTPVARTIEHTIDLTPRALMVIIHDASETVAQLEIPEIPEIPEVSAPAPSSTEDPQTASSDE